MKNYKHIKSKREFVRSRRKYLKLAKKAIADIRCGCAIKDIYGKYTNAMMSAVTDIRDGLRRIDEITKKLTK